MAKLNATPLSCRGACPSIHKKEIVIVLDNIRSVHNVGAIFRTADAAGVSKIFLTGYTPAPIDRFGRFRSDFAKAALGAEKNVLWESISQIAECLTYLKTQGYFIIALEQDSRAIDYKKITTTYPLAFVVGNETKGIKKETLELCDVIAEIPMKGKKESLNVAVTTGIALFRILNI